MAILKEHKDQYEVRVKKYSDNTYFDEHLRLDAREKPGATSCRRYIVPEKDENFVFEVTLHEGFDFEQYDQVRLELFLPGMKNPTSFIDISRPEDSRILSTSVSRELKSADLTMGGLTRKGAKFAWKDLEKGDSSSYAQTLFHN